MCGGNKQHLLLMHFQTTLSCEETRKSPLPHPTRPRTHSPGSPGSPPLSPRSRPKSEPAHGDIFRFLSPAPVVSSTNSGIATPLLRREASPLSFPLVDLPVLYLETCLETDAELNFLGSCLRD